MKVYDNRPVEKLEQLANELSKAMDEENRTATFGAGAYFYSFLSFVAVIGLGIAFDHSVFRLYLPCAVMTCIVAINMTINAVRWNSWNKRNKVQQEYFKQSQVVAEFNTNSVLQLMAMHEFVDMSKTPESVEHRTIN